MRKTVLKLLIPNEEKREKMYIRKRFFQRFGKEVNYDAPETFAEKIQALRFTEKEHKDNMNRLVDKYLVREYVEEVVGKQYLNELYGVYDDAKDIDFEELPNQFVIKYNHGCHYNIICPNKAELDISEAKRKLKKWKKRNYYYAGYEWQYRNIKPKIVIEKFLKNSDGTPLVDYKIFVFNGKPLYIKLMIYSCSPKKVCFYNSNWEKQPFVEFDEKIYEGEIKKPDNLDEMLYVAKKLVGNYKFLRVDLYNVGGKIYFGELTFTPSRGFLKFCPSEFNLILGKQLQI